MTRFNLVIVHTHGEQDLSDWLTVASKVATLAPDIEVGIADNRFRNLFLRRWQETRPSLVFSASILRKFTPRMGRIYAGKALSKWQEITRMREGGVAVPLTTLWSEGVEYPPHLWGERVVAKPLRGRRGIGIQLLQIGQVHRDWESLTNNGENPFLLQRFIDTGPRPSHYRVLTGFGVPLYMTRRWSAKAQGDQARAPRDSAWRLVTNSSDHIEIVEDEQVLSFARRIAATVPEIPILGCDIVKEEHSGSLYALEANSFGQTWHFSSDTHNRLRERSGLKLDYYSQFGALALLAEELVRHVRAEAR